MLQIKTPKGWSKIQIESKVDDYFSGQSIPVAADPTNPTYQALRMVNGGTAEFIGDGAAAKCAVSFDESPRLEVDRIAYCLLRLTPV